MSGEISINSEVDTTMLDEVEQECYRILFQQRLRYNAWWYSSPMVTKVVPVLRWTGLLLSILGAVLCLFYLVFPSACPKWFFAEMYLMFFVAIGLFFYVMPSIESKFVARMEKAGGSGCRRMARRLLAKARKFVPYRAQYDIKGDLITYYRVKDANWRQVWSRRLKGYAVVGKNAALLFRKPTSLQPVMLILYENDGALRQVLRELELPHHGVAATETNRGSVPFKEGTE